MFHLLTHAAFKALLFLAAGSVIHAVGTQPDAATWAGCAGAMPVTFVTMTVGLAALAGLPPFAGFFSKEAVLGAAEETALHDGGRPPPGPAGWCSSSALLTVAVTAAYATRLWLLTFFGAAARRASPAHEPSPAMRWPLVVLAVPARCSGCAGLPSAGCRAAGPGAWPLALTDGSSWRIGAARRRWSPRAVGALALVGVAAGGVDPARSTRPAARPGCGRRCERAFCVDDRVRPRWSSGRCGAAPRAVRWTDDSVVVTARSWAPAAARGRLGGLLRRAAAAATSQTYLTGAARPACC